MSKIAFLFPGQGAQSVGMGRELAETLPAARALYDRAGEILGFDLARKCFEGPAEDLDSTVISQPALFVTSLAAVEALRGQSPDAVEADWRTAPIAKRLRAMLGFLEKLTLRPDELAPEDADDVRAAGVSDEAMVDAIHVAALFNMIVRLADSLGWDVPTWESCLTRGEAMLSRGYALEPT